MQRSGNLFLFENTTYIKNNGQEWRDGNTCSKQVHNKYVVMNKRFQKNITLSLLHNMRFIF